VLASTFPRWEGDFTPPFVFHLSAGLAAKGHEVHVLAPHAKAAATEEQLGPLHVHRFRYAPSPLETLCYDAGMIENLRRKPIRWGLVPFFLAAEFLAVLWLVRRHRIDVIHAHWFLPQGLVAGLAKPFLRRPIVMTAHGADVFTTRSPFRRLLLRGAARSADVATVNSIPMHAELERLTGHDSQVIPMGVDTAQFRPNSDGDVGNGERVRSTPRLLFVGRLAEKKGVKYLVQALPEVLEASPNATLTIVGDGPERSDLAAQVRRLGLTEHVEFAGSVTNEQLPDWYRAADVFVAPSVVSAEGDTEALGVVLLEAAACGVPLVASNVGGISDIVRDGETGLLVAPESPSELARAILRLIQDERLRGQLSGNALRHVAANFSWESVTARFDALVRELSA